TNVQYKRDEEGRPVFSLVATEGDVDSQQRQIWRFSGEGTPLDKIHAGGVAYHLDIVDEDDMVPERDIAGTVVAIPDMPPTATLGIVSNYWMPSAKPKIAFRVSDDFGVEQAEFNLTISREASGEEEKQNVSLLEAGNLIPATDLPESNISVLDLSPYALTKGDEVTVELQVRDYRGKKEGATGASNSLKLFIADQNQILANVTNIDENLIEKFDLIEKAVRAERPRRN
ncbi:MAG: DUF4175 domain-containing protein, partial [Pirellulales bacterium]|nr:DUF4175 domain-containing protein [Pirellulales bacterium]